MESVTGSGQFQRTLQTFRTFSFQARKYADGTVSGSWQFNNHGDQFSDARGDITCFTIVGNVAQIGGTFLSSNNPDWVGSDARLIRPENRSDRVARRIEKGLDLRWIHSIGCV